MRRRSFVALLAFAAAWLLPGASAGSAAPARGSLAGTVLGPDGKVVAGARVFLQMSDARTPRTTLTDAAGHYSFRSLRSGLYELRAHAGGHWSDWKHNIVVRSGHETSVTLRLLLSRSPVRKASPAHELTGKICEWAVPVENSLPLTLQRANQVAQFNPETVAWKLFAARTPNQLRAARLAADADGNI